MDGSKGCPVDPRRALAYYKAACDGFDSPSCIPVANAYEVGSLGMPEDHRLAARMYELAINSGIAAGKTGLARLVERGLGGVQQNFERAIVLFREACNEGDVDACVQVAEYQLVGAVDMQVDTDSSSLPFQRGCNAGIAEACFRVAQFAEEGAAEVEQSDAAAAHNYYLSCEGGYWEACWELGALHERIGEARAARAFDERCTAGDVHFCVTLGEMLEGGRTVSRDDWKAVALFATACNAGIPQGCDGLARMYREGRAGLTNDSLILSELERRGCGSEGPNGCPELLSGYK